MLPETFLQPGQSRLVVRDGQPALFCSCALLCARCKSASAYNCAAELVRNRFVECVALLFLPAVQLLGGEASWSGCSPKVWTGLGLS